VTALRAAARIWRLWFLDCWPLWVAFGVSITLLVLVLGVAG
jgi:hypothetical protein